MLASPTPETVARLEEEKVELQNRVEALEVRVAATNQRTRALEAEERRENTGATMMRGRAAYRLERLAAGQLTLESATALALSADPRAAAQLGTLEAELGELATEATLDAAALEARATHDARRHVYLALTAWTSGAWTDAEALLFGAAERLRVAEEYAASAVAQRPVMPNADPK